ncbi:hypothetical protein I79_011187 [Cricetulus griseus]|uniref:Secreted protein n=1 Tax=Cricetulus griseus TaxID=10029 RepID=G3HKG7_CRIGR|nr:hypothetical protein I79_011187 [Cricetulus griseus]
MTCAWPFLFSPPVSCFPLPLLSLLSWILYGAALRHDVLACLKSTVVEPDALGLKTLKQGQNKYFLL